MCLNFKIKIQYFLIATMFLFFFCNCNKKVESINSVSSKEEIKEFLPTEVELYLLNRQVFNSNIVSEGKVFAQKKARVLFSISEIVTDIKVQIGSYVKVGDTLAVQRNFIYKNKVDQCLLAYDRSMLDFQDILIGQGYVYSDSSIHKIPRNLIEIAEIKSGLTKAKYDLELAQFGLNSSYLISPIDGVVANLWIKEDNYANVNDIFCDIIDINNAEVVFKSIEDEYYICNKGMGIELCPYFNTDLRCKGILTEINPIIDENGLFAIKAQFDNSKYKFCEGTNVKVYIHAETQNELFVPKSAVVMRSEKPVVFTYSHGLAYWHYVETGLENESSIIITKGLNEFDTIIYKGNSNLGNEAKVIPIKNGDFSN